MHAVPASACTGDGSGMPTMASTVMDGGPEGGKRGRKSCRRRKAGSVAVREGEERACSGMREEGRDGDAEGFSDMQEGRGPARTSRAIPHLNIRILLSAALVPVLVLFLIVVVFILFLIIVIVVLVFVVLGLFVIRAIPIDVRSTRTCCKGAEWVQSVT